MTNSGSLDVREESVKKSAILGEMKSSLEPAARLAWSLTNIYCYFLSFEARHCFIVTELGDLFALVMKFWRRQQQQKASSFCVIL